MRLQSLFLIAALGLGACATQQDATPATADATPTATQTSKLDMPIANAPAPATTTQVPGMPSACNAEAAKDAVGQMATDDVLLHARVAAGAADARFLKPNQAITMEYRGDRLNLTTDAKGKVTRVSCG